MTESASKHILTILTAACLIPGVICFMAACGHAAETSDTEASECLQIED